MAVHRYLLEHFRMDIKISVKAPDGATEVRTDFLPSTNPSVFLVGVGLTSPGTAATSGLLYSPR
jgi:hypothetical protein